jgi:outer membrane protein OmpA-like peptidoglycan-associated protein
MNLKLNLLLSAFAATAVLPQSVSADEHKPIILAQQQAPAKPDDNKAKPAPKRPAPQATQPQAKPAPAKPAQAAPPQNRAAPAKPAQTRPAAPPQNKPAQATQPPLNQPAANAPSRPAPAKQPATAAPKPATPPAATAAPKPATPPPATAQQPAAKPATPPKSDPHGGINPRANQPQPNRQPAANQPANKPDNRPAAGQNQPPAAGRPANQPPAAARDTGPKKIEAVRSERKETKEGNRTVIRENNRTFVRVNNTTIIRHDDTDRFRRGGGDVRVNRRGNQTETVIRRPGGVRIVNVMDDRGRLVRRTRWVNGREYVLIDNSRDHRRHGRRDRDDFTFIVNLPPPVIHIPRERYIVDYRVAPRPIIYETLVAPPVMALDRRFTLDEIRYNAVVRERMPVIDIDSITFESGSWEVTPDQAALLEPLAEAMGRAIAKNPAEVYLIGGHTDSTGEPEDNLSLSDRRAEAVAEVLTSQFNVPPENLVTQGYGETNLRVNVQGPEPRNRYVSIRRITPLLVGQK